METLGEDKLHLHFSLSLPFTFTFTKNPIVQEKLTAILWLKKTKGGAGNSHTWNKP